MLVEVSNCEVHSILAQLLQCTRCLPLLGRCCGDGDTNTPHLVQTVESSSGGAIELRAKAALGRVEAVTQMVHAHAAEEESEEVGDVVKVAKDEVEDGEVKTEA